MQTHQKLVAGAAIALTTLLGATDVSAQTSFRVAVGDAAGSAQHELGWKFVEELEARTDGAYTAELFLNGQPGREQNTPHARHRPAPANISRFPPTPRMV